VKLTVNGRTQQVGLDEELHAFRRGHGQQSNIGEIIAVHIDKAFIRDGVYNTALARPIARAGRRGDYFEMTPETMLENGPAGLTARLHSGAVDREPPNSCIAGVPRKRQGSARMLSRTKSSKRVGWRAKSCGGGESVSQSPLKDKAFSTFLDQNPPFEPRPEKSEQRSVSVSSTSGLRRYRLRGGSDAELAGEEKGIAPHIPVNDKSQRDNGTFSRGDFQYDPASDVYHCPRGKQLRTSGTVHNDKTLLYRASRRDCGICPLKPQCCPKEPSRKIPRDIHECARDVARSFVGTEGFEQSRRERKKFEIRFAHLKHILRLDRLRLRGPRGAQDEFVLAAIAQNLRRLAALVARPPPAEALCIA